MANRVPKPLDFNKVIKKAVDSDTPFKMVLHAARDVQNSVYSVMNVVALFCKTLVNPDAAAKAIEEATRRTGSAKGSAPSNPWKQQQQKKKTESNERKTIRKRQTYKFNSISTTSRRHVRINELDV
eukprot:365963_1